MAAVFLTAMLATLDQTIVGTALPKMVAELQGYDIYGWVFASYLLAATGTVALVGKFSDLFGRKRLVLWSVGVFAAGSLLCGLSWSMPLLVAFRAIQGIGGGGITTSTLAIIGDLFAPKERAKWQTINSLSYAASSAIGPVLGGVLTDNISWRWIFWINLPLAAIAITAMGLALPRIQTHRRPDVDWAGAALTLTGVLALMLALTWGGRDFPWLSWPIALLLAAALGCGLLLPWIERRVKDAIIAPGLLRGPVLPFCFVLTFTQGLVWYGAILLVPLFLQTVTGLSATRAGGDLTPSVVLSGVAGITANLFMVRTARYKPMLVAGGLASLLACVWLASRGADATELQVLFAFLLLGIGIGWVISPTIIALQNGVQANQQGMAMGVMSLFRQMGSTIGTTAMGAVVGGSATQASALAPAISRGFTALTAGAALMLAMGIAVRGMPLRGRTEMTSEIVPEPVLSS